VPVELLIETIEKTVARLFRITTIIRDPSTRPTPVKSLRYKKLDDQYETNLFDVIVPFYVDYIASCFAQYRQDNIQPMKDAATNLLEPVTAEVRKFDFQDKSLKGSPKSDEAALVLIKRFAQANVRRRQQFEYWSYHEDKLEQYFYNAINPETLVTVTYHDPTLAETDKQQDILPANPTITTATRIAPRFSFEADNQSLGTVSQYSVASKSYNSEKLGFPAAPDVDETDDAFKCPYCLTLCPIKMLSTKAWM
jgi:hypothetical protein